MVLRCLAPGVTMLACVWKLICTNLWCPSIDSVVVSAALSMKASMKFASRVGDMGMERIVVLLTQKIRKQHQLNRLSRIHFFMRKRRGRNWRKTLGLGCWLRRM
ncbi:hypothetical protein LINPERHAP2_LOCUS17510 [Linum perenne]